MRIRMLVDLSGPGLLLGPGDEHDFPQDEAIRLVSAGFAVPVDAGPPIETAIQKRPAAERRTRKKSDVVPG